MYHCILNYDDIIFLVIFQIKISSIFFLFTLLFGKMNIMKHCKLNYDDIIISIMFHIKISSIIFFSRISNLCFLGIFCHNFLRQSKNSINFEFQFQSTSTFKKTKLLLPKIREHQNTEQYQGFAGRGELDLDSDGNWQASGKLLQSNTAPSQCELFP